MKKRDLTDEEKRLWQHLAEGIKPLHSPLAEDAALPLPPTQTKKQAPQKTLKPPPVKNPDYSPLGRGAYAGIDGNTATRFRKGKLDIDATLDLHGYSGDKAHVKLKAFIRSHYAQGSRCLLVITGKGKIDAPGLLKTSLPQWINQDDMRPMVLAFDHAQQQHGGSGAYYILLKRKR